MELVYILVGILVGAVLGYFIAKSRSGVNESDSRKGEELRMSLAAKTASLDQIQADSNQLRTDLSRERENAFKLGEERSALRQKIDDLISRLEEQKQNAEMQKQAFEKVAGEVFEKRAEKLAESNKNNIDQILNPLKTKIGEFQEKIEKSDAQSNKLAGELKQQLEDLSKRNDQLTTSAKSLVLALKGDPKMQGNWGEMQLETIMQSAGLERGVHYLKEKNEKNEEGNNQRLDFIINLPDGKHLIIDSKVSLISYTRYHETEEEGEKQRHLNDHVQSIRNHIKILADKNYQNLRGLRPPDYVFMFIANEPALAAAQRMDPDLFQEALSRNVAVVSPTTLLVTMRTVAFIWRQDKQNKNALEIARQAGDLYDKFVGFSEDLLEVGARLKRTTDSYEESMNKLTEGTGNLIRRTEKLKELGAKSSKAIDSRLLERADSSEEKLSDLDEKSVAQNDVFKTQSDSPPEQSI